MFYCSKRNNIWEARDTPAQKLPAEGILFLLLSANQAEEKLCLRMCVCVHAYRQHRGFLAPTQLHQDSRVMNAGMRARRDAGWRREGWETGMNGASAGHDNEEPSWQVGGCKFVSSPPTCSTVTHCVVLSWTLSSST